MWAGKAGGADACGCTAFQKQIDNRIEIRRYMLLIKDQEGIKDLINELMFQAEIIKYRCLIERKNFLKG